MSEKTRNGSGRGFRFSDGFVLVFFLFIAALSVNIFWLDLTQSIRLQNVEPAGVVIIKKNTVQRRLARRVLWDRLANESPVYVGDLISVAEVSSATLNIEEHTIDLDENTLIRIMLSHDGKGLRIVLNGGNLSLVSGPNSRSLTLDLNGQIVRTSPGAALSASTGDRGMSLSVSAGTVELTREDGSREVSSGSMIAMNVDGTERRERAVVVTQPAPNARFIKSGDGSFPVNFEWNRINLLPEETLRMEISGDRSFKNISQTIDNLNRRVSVAFNDGLWYWRLVFRNTVLSEGRLTVAGAGPQLISPAQNSVFRYQSELPSLNYQWTKTEDVASYILEVSDEPEFRNPEIRRQGSSSFYADSSLGSGTWYWRVLAVLHPVYSGRDSDGVYSRTSIFRIEYSAADTEGLSIADSFALEAPFTTSPLAEAPRLAPPPPLAPTPTPRPIPLPAPRPTTAPAPTQAPVATQTARPAVQVRLLEPADGHSIDGLTALRQQTVFRWSCDSAVARSRFVLSQNQNPLRGRPAIEINNPDSVIRIDRLGEGTWYWTVEVRTTGGLAAAAQQPRRLQVLPSSLLAAPQNLRPAANHRLGIEEIRSAKSISFSWDAVQGANAYIFTLHQQTASGRVQIFSDDFQNQTNYTLEDLKLLDKGTFFWQVEAVSMGRGGMIEQHGRLAESSFVFDFPSPGPVNIEDTGVLYGN